MKFEGSFIEDRLERGVYYYSNGDTYKGDFNAWNQREGVKGEYIFEHSVDTCYCARHRDSDKLCKCHGQIMQGVSGELLRRSEGGGEEEDEFQEGYKVEIQFHGRAARIQGEIHAVNEDGTFDVKCEQDDRCMEQFLGGFKADKRDGTACQYTWCGGNSYLGDYQRGYREGDGTFLYTEGPKHDT